MKPLITSRTDWTEQLLSEIYGHIEDIALNDLKLDVYPNQIEIISSEQMLDAYSASLPIHYDHWSYGKDFQKNFKKYQSGRMGLAYEIIFNSSPCISYLMEENNAVTQALVIAHAAFGHNFVFKNNYLFKYWTTASNIIDYILFAKNYIRECENKYGEDAVEKLLDAAHTLSAHGVDKRKRKHKKKKSEEDLQRDEVLKEDEKQKDLDIIIKTTSVVDEEKEKTDEDLDKVDDEENLIYFIYKNSPILEKWQREILRIIYKIRQYFYPQSANSTQVVHEGFATHTHFYIMDQLEQKGLISPDAQIAWLHLHSSVIYQPDMRDKRYDGTFNPYALGFDILKEIRRICENPTAEDKEWFPNLIGKDWREELKYAASEFRDESFIEQYMTPNLMRKYKMMTIKYEGNKGIVADISDEMGYRNMRSVLAQKYTSIDKIPDISVNAARMRGDRTLTLQYRPYKGRTLHKYNADATMKYVRQLWGYPVEIVELDENNIATVKFRIS